MIMPSVLSLHVPHFTCTSRSHSCIYRITLLFKMWALVFVLAAPLFSSISAHCPKLEVMEEFDLPRLDGLWYEWSSFGTLSLFPIHSCHVLKLYIGADLKSATAMSDMLAFPYSDGDGSDGQHPYLAPDPKHIKSKWHIIDKNPATNGNLVVQLNPLIFEFGEYPLSIIDTDYDNYLAFIICKENWPLDLDVGYIMTRKNEYNTTEIEAIYKTVDAALVKNSKHRVKHEKFTVAPQEHCSTVNFPSSDVELTPEFTPEVTRIK